VVGESSVLSGCFFNDGYLFIGQAVQLVHQLVDLPVGGVDPVEVSSAHQS